jgi:hypothetical protein
VRGWVGGAEVGYLGAQGCRCIDAKELQIV